MSFTRSIVGVSRTLVSIVKTRLELFAVEVSQQRTALVQMLMLAFGSMLFLTLALLVFTLLIALLFWPTEYRYWAIAILFLSYALLGGLMGYSLIRRLKSDEYPFQATLEELRRDVQSIENLCNKPAPQADSEDGL